MPHIITHGKLLTIRDVQCHIKFLESEFDSGIKIDIGIESDDRVFYLNVVANCMCIFKRLFS